MDIRQIIRLAEALDWTVDTNSKGHLQFWAPDADRDGRPTVTAARTPSDHRSIKNLSAELRRAGLPVPHRGHTPKKEKP